MISLEPVPEACLAPMVRFLEAWLDGVACAPDSTRAAQPDYGRAFWLGHEARRLAVRAEAVRLGVMDAAGSEENGKNARDGNYEFGGG